MRAFIAIELSSEVRAALAAAVGALARCTAKVKWVEPDNVHLTLKFLGSIDDGMAEQVKRAMADAAGRGGFGFVVEGLGRFPPRGKPRVVWAGVSEGAEALKALQAVLEAVLRPLGFEKERDYVPHLTIGRVKRPQGAEALVAALEPYAGTRFGACRASEMVLFQSELTPRGPVYTAVARQAL